MNIKIIINIGLLLVLSSCVLFSNFSNKSTKQLLIEELKTRYILYKQLNKNQQDKDGFIYADTCDSLLFSALNAIGRNEEINIKAAMISKGRWYSKPTHSGCDRSISRDMLMGLMLYSLHFKKLDILLDLYEYGKKNNWKMGTGNDLEKELRTIMSPGQVGLLAQIIEYLGGPSYKEKDIIQIFSVENDYRGHLTLLHFYALTKMNKSLNLYEKTILLKYKDSFPNSPLVDYLYNKIFSKDYNFTIHLLINIYPKDRLPTGEDFCQEWLIQRIGDELYQLKCPGYTWSGGDFLFISKLILDEQEN